MAEYLWDLHVSAVAADNPALEPWPLAGGFLHFRLLPHFGLPIGELWYLEDSGCGLRGGRHIRVPADLGSAKRARRGGVAP